MISKIKDCYQKIHEEKENKVDFSPLLYQTEDTSHDGCTKENVKGLKRGKEKKTQNNSKDNECFKIFSLLLLVRPASSNREIHRNKRELLYK